jgi:hypothetical protein
MVTQGAQEGETIHAGERKIADDHVGRALVKSLEAGIGVRASRDGGARGTERLGENLAGVLVVLDHEDMEPEQVW